MNRIFAGLSMGRPIWRNKRIRLPQRFSATGDASPVAQ